MYVCTNVCLVGRENDFIVFVSFLGASVSSFSVIVVHFEKTIRKRFLHLRKR